MLCAEGNPLGKEVVVAQFWTSAQGAGQIELSKVTDSGLYREYTDEPVGGAGVRGLIAIVDLGSERHKSATLVFLVVRRCLNSRARIFWLD